MLVHTDNRRVDHLHGSVMGASESVHDLGPDSRSFEGTTVVHPRHAAWFVGQHRPDGSPPCSATTCTSGLRRCPCLGGSTILTRATHIHRQASDVAIARAAGCAYDDRC